MIKLINNTAMAAASAAAFAASIALAEAAGLDLGRPLKWRRPDRGLGDAGT